jgi:TusA-related sulfurtransferase
MPQTATKNLDRLQNGDSLKILTNHHFATDEAFEMQFAPFFFA